MALTPEQQAIVLAPVGNLLVSAAAGSGKTAVMTDRIVARIAARSLDINEVLVMTFTEAAAGQMREKIRAKLQAALAEASGAEQRRYLSRQLTLLPGAAISTIHAFCLTVIRNFCHLAVDDTGRPLIEPGFSVDDGIHADLLCRQALDDVLSSRYEQIDRAPSDDPPAWTADFYRLVDSFGSGRSDEALRELMLGFYRFLRSMPDYRQHIDQYRQVLTAAGADFAGSEHAAVLLAQVRLLTDRACAAVPQLLTWLDDGVVLIKQADRNRDYHIRFRQTLQALPAIQAALAAGTADWDTVRSLARPLADLEIPRAHAKDTPEKKEFIDQFSREVAEAVYCLSGLCGASKFRAEFQFDTRYLLARPAAEIAADIESMLPAINQLFDLVLELDLRYQAVKRDQSLVDFSDFEHLALLILRQEEARTYYRQRCREIYIDEYQDTSSIQEELLQAISQANVFMVGDVKQSIYRFRHARPQIFIAKSRSFLDPDQGRLFVLNRNFRSVAGILTAVNQVFSQLMSRQAGEIDYDETQALVNFRADAAANPPVELLLVDAASFPTEMAHHAAPVSDLDSAMADPVVADTALDGPDPNGSDSDTAAELADPELAVGLNPDSAAAAENWLLSMTEKSQYQKEAMAVLVRIQELLADGTALADVVVLSRSRAVGRVFSDTLASAGIATAEDTRDGFLDSPELKLMEALLQVLDNPRQDIPLAAVMASVLFSGGFTIAELYQIRLADRQYVRERALLEAVAAADRLTSASAARQFHEAVWQYAQTGPDCRLQQKVQAFLDWIEQWRNREQTLRISEWLAQLLEETGYLAQVAASPNGSAKIRELQLFQDWAGQFERQRQMGLFSFIRYIERLREQGVQESPFGLANDGARAVKVMTIHRSKGLEFPVVFLVGIQASIQPRSSRDRFLVGETLGVGFDWVDPDRMIQYPTHLKLAMLEENKAASLAEEMRLLYVAMTRARDRLFLSAAVKIIPGSGAKRLAQAIAWARTQTTVVLPAHRVLSCRSYLEWIVLTLARHPALDWSQLAPAAETGYHLPALAEEASQTWQIRWYGLADLVQLPDRDQLDRRDELARLVQPVKVAATPGWTPLPAVNPAEVLDQWLDLGQMADPALLSAMRSGIFGAYRYGQAARTPVKLAVSELKRREQDEMVYGNDQTLGLAAAPSAASPGPLGINRTLRSLRPDAGQLAAGAGGAAQGALLHRFLRIFDLPSAVSQPDAAEIQRQITALASRSVFLPDEAATLAMFAADLAAFARSDLAITLAAVLASGQALYREMPFTLALPACEVYPDNSGFADSDQVLVQGIIDCWFFGPDGPVLVDYKSDWIEGDDLICQQVLTDRYRRQLSYYARAIEAATARPVRQQLIWHIRRRRVFSLTGAAPINVTAGIPAGPGGTPP